MLVSGAALLTSLPPEVNVTIEHDSVNLIVNNGVTGKKVSDSVVILTKVIVSKMTFNTADQRKDCSVHGTLELSLFKEVVDVEVRIYYITLAIDV